VAESAFQAQMAPGLHFRPADKAALEVSEDWPVEIAHATELARRVTSEARKAMERDPAHREFAPMPQLAVVTWPPTIAEIADYIRALDEYRAARDATDAQFNVQEAVLQVALVRDIFGNPFRPMSVDPSWLTSTVLALAEGIYQDRAFDRMPILADALQDAGCDNEEILNHCRQPAEHVRGCWVIDLLTGRK
jgi:hypothetical protein